MTATFETDVLTLANSGALAGTWLSNSDDATPVDHEVFRADILLHREMLAAAESSQISSWSPVRYYRIHRSLVDQASGSQAYPASSARSMPASFETNYSAIQRQLCDLAENEESPVERGAVCLAQRVVENLRHHQLAPPEISWHGGDAVVMLWVLGDTTYALTVTDGELGYVVRRNHRSLKLVDGLTLDTLRLEDFR